MKKFNNPADILLNRRINPQFADEPASKASKKSYLLKVPQDIFSRINQKAQDEGRSFNSYVNWLLKKDLE